MPWMKVEPMDEKIRMIGDWLDGAGVSELTRKYRVSRKTVYKWIQRYKESGAEGLGERSRRPHGNPNTTSPEMVKMILEAKKQWPGSGPKKLIHRLKRKHPELDLPAVSTAGAWLKKNGLVKKRRRVRRVPNYEAPLLKADQPNDVWSVDYKGEFKTQDGKYCYPLTISDNASRYLLCCHGLLGPRLAETKALFVRVFEAYGLPAAIRSDNGGPFAGRSIGGLSRLSVWWLKLGILPERIKKGAPQENGRHERMHRTLKAETTRPAEADLARQNLSFCDFRRDYNEERPHEGISMQVPSEVYSPSRREYFGEEPGFEYDSEFVVRSVKKNGEIRYDGALYFLTNLLRHERIGFLAVDDEGPLVYAGRYPVCKLNLRQGKMRELSRAERMGLSPMSPV